MIVAIAAVEIHIPEARSLKEKRKVIKGLIERVRHRFRVSITETDYHDLHQRAEVGLAGVTRTPREAEILLGKIRALIDTESTCFITNWSADFIEGA